MIVLLYGLGSAFIVLTSVSTLIWSDAVLSQKAPVIFPESEVLFDPGFEEGSASISKLDLVVILFPL
jgi:hypothetical protein